MTHSSVAPYSDAPYSVAYDPDADFDRWYTILTARRIATFLGPSERILEVGSATGLLTQSLAGSGRRFVCVERSAAFAARARARALDGVEVLHAAIEGCEPGWAFDHVLAINVLHEIADVSAVVAGLVERLGPHGRLHVTLPNPHSLHRLSAMGSGLIADLRQNSARGAQYGTLRLQYANEFADDMAKLGLVEVAREGVMAKPLPNAAMARLSDELIEAYDALSRMLPSHGAMTYFVFRRADG